MPPAGKPNKTIIRRLNVHEVQREHERFWGLCEMRHVPKEGGYPCLDIIWPKKPLVARVIPEGIIPLGAEHGFSHDAQLEEFFSKHAAAGVVAWSPEASHYGSYAGLYGQEFRVWMAQELIFGTICCIASDAEIALIADEDLHFSVIGAPPHISSDLERIFGGRDAMREEFIRHLEVGDFGGGGKIDKHWAYKHLMQWCDW